MKYAKMLGLCMLIMVLTVLGCKPNDTKTGDAKKDADAAKKDTASSKDAQGSKKDDHVHGKGPNGGVVFDLGKFHAEFTVDHDKKECTVLILGSDEKTPTPVECKELTVTTKETKTKEGKAVAAMTIKLLPVDEAAGKASKFVGMNLELANVTDYEGTVIGTINGKTAHGDFKE